MQPEKLFLPFSHNWLCIRHSLVCRGISQDWLPNVACGETIPFGLTTQLKETWQTLITQRFQFQSPGWEWLVSQAEHMELLLHCEMQAGGTPCSDKKKLDCSYEDALSSVFCTCLAFSLIRCSIIFVNCHPRILSPVKSNTDVYSYINVFSDLLSSWGVTTRISLISRAVQKLLLLWVTSRIDAPMAVWGLFEIHEGVVCELTAWNTGGSRFIAICLIWIPPFFEVL